VNYALYCDILRPLRENVRTCCRELWPEQTWLIQHDNAQLQNSVLTLQFLEKYKMVVIRHPPHSPNLAACDFFLFPEMKLKLKGRWFGTVEEIEAESERVLDCLTK
jgi:hypothetical protein